MLQIVITAKGKKQLEGALLKACWEIADMIYSMAQQNLAERTWAGDGTDGTYTSIISDTGELLSSGSVERTETGATVRFSAPYATSVEYGIAPGGRGPPADVIAAWCRRKLGLPRREAESAAWAIRQKIKTEGTTARPFLRDAVYSVIAAQKGIKIK
jgi:hypothetical protein